MSRRRDGRLQLDRLDHEHRAFRELLKSLVLSGTTTESFAPEDFELLKEAVDRLVPEIVARVRKLLPRGLLRFEDTMAAGSQMTIFPISKGRRKEDLAAAAESYLPWIVHELLRGLADTLTGELTRLRYLGPLRSYPPRHLAFAQHHDPNWYAGGGYAWDVLRRDAVVRDAVNAWLSAPDRLQTPYRLVHREFVPVDQLEGPLAEELATESKSWPPEGSPAEEMRTTTFAEDLEDLATRLLQKIKSADIEKLTEVVLIDQRSGTPVSHRDVGIGISQVLPVLVTAYAARDELIAIEQPEIHLHPALQADLGDVLIQSALSQQKNRMVIETHSEHILLRVMRRMRETARKKNQTMPPVRPGDVAVLYVLRDNSRSVVLELRLDDEGTLLDPWPGGFFEESYRERFGLGPG